MKRIFFPALFALPLFMTSCTDNSKAAASLSPSTPKTETPAATTTTPAVVVDKSKPAADAATILARKQVPVLCYHHIKDFTGREKPVTKDYIVPPAAFREQMKSLADSGYHTILPEDYNNYLLYGTPLPEKPVMITFDDTDEEQYTIGAAEMNKYGFKGVYFIMTISIGRPRYMTNEQLKDLSDNGHLIACHTWDHHNVKKYAGADWEAQLNKPKARLESITGKPVEYFAYPFGLWNEAAIPELKKRGFKGAYQLSDKRDQADPIYSLRRMLVPGTMSTASMHKWMIGNFK
ncbi:MAG TPA: polysaccharide deacetylase family protein [Chitinophagaceae bacterium]|nr:polysaccharide deacetylase family protein [Chitinophagaceae bacterium]